MHRELFVAHRGWRNRFPENTILAVEQAILAGALFIEVDIRFSADRKAIIFHDDTLDRMCGISKAVRALSYEELIGTRVSDAKRLGSHDTDTRINGLSELCELLKQHPQVSVFIEIKRSSLTHCQADYILDYLADLLEPIRSQVVLISFNYPIIAQALTQGWRAGAVVEHWDDIAQQRIPAECSCIFLDQEIIPEGYRLEQLPWESVIYEVTDLATAKHWLAQGADKIETYRIGEILADIDAGQY